MLRDLMLATALLAPTAAPRVAAAAPTRAGAPVVQTVDWRHDGGHWDRDWGRHRHGGWSVSFGFGYPSYGVRYGYPSSYGYGYTYPYSYPYSYGYSYPYRYSYPYSYAPYAYASPGYVWVPGGYVWVGTGYAWVPGHWEVRSGYGY